MKKIDKLVLDAFLGPFLITFLVVVFILLNINMLKYFDDIIGKGLDGLVLAKSGFSHSVNYRSVIIFATAEKVEDYAQKVEALVLITNKLIPNRWDDLRKETESEIRKTTVLSFSLDEASAKIRTGGPNDEPEDRDLPIWSGVIPLETVRRPPIPDDSSAALPLPPYL